VKNNQQRWQEKLHRLENANQLLAIIASSGRNFFAHKGSVSRFRIDSRCRILFVDAYTSKEIAATDGRSAWHGFSEGGTLRALARELAGYIRDGTKIKGLGPWPDWYCAGDPWGYGSEMARVQDEAQRLGIIAPRYAAVAVAE
jgi:hypothetical protein